MTFEQMKRWEPFGVPPDQDDRAYLRILNWAVPALRLDARGKCAAYFGMSDEADKLGINLIEKYILQNYEFDSVDISHIVRECRIYREGQSKNGSPGAASVLQQ
jgi:hypothetical protein